MKNSKQYFFNNYKQDVEYLEIENTEFNDIFKKVCEYIGKDTTTDNFSLQQTAHKFIGPKRFKGVFPYDVLPKLKNGQSAIINTDAHDKPGTHWVAIYKKGKNLYYFFDSYGRNWQSLIPDLKIRVLGTDTDIISTQSVRQFGIQSCCGQMSISFLIYLYNQPKPAMALVI